MKLSHWSLAVLIALTCPAVAQADTVYYEEAGVNGIESISGTVVQDTDSFVRIKTEDGRTVSIPKANVFKVIRDRPAASSSTDMPAESQAMRDALGESPTMRDALAEEGYSDVDPDISGATRVYHYGLKGGMNVSNMNVDPQGLEEDDSLRSYALGAWIGTPLNRRLAVQAEALYSVKGDSETAGGYTTSTRMAYIDVPVLARVGFMHGASARPSLFLGPSLGINLSASSKLEGDGSDIEVDVKDDVRTFDLGLVVGGGVDFPVGKRTVGVEFRYSKGLTNVAGDGANGTARNDVIALLGTVGLK